MSADKENTIMQGLFDQQPESLFTDRFINTDRQQASVKPYDRRESPPDSYDQQEAQNVTDRAIELADEHANPAWKDMFTESLRVVASKLPEFTTDEVWEHVGTLPDPPTTGEKRAVGALIRKATKDGVIAYKTDAFRRSRRANCHRSIIQVYESRIYGQGDPLPVN